MAGKMRLLLLLSSSWARLLACVCLAAGFEAAQAAESRKPNILFLFNDDQDLVLGSLDYLDSVTKRIQPAGFTFTNHYATVALCCPSRIALLRGQQAHNTNITNVAAPGGGYDKFRLSGQDEDYLPQWLARAGYRTEYIGKLMNQYGYYNYWHKPKGWDHFDGLLDPYTYIYNTPVWSLNGEHPVIYEGQHQTDVLRAKAVNRLKTLLSNSSATGQPWFLEVAGVAPHQQFNSTGKFPPVPLTRHEHLYPNLTAPRTPNFNPPVQHKPSWVGELPLMDDEAIAFSDETYRRRAQALAGINEMFHELLDVLEDAGELDNTVIIFSSDHGYHVGQHRVPAGKTLPYREDTQVPFVVRAPAAGIPAGASRLPSNHVDIAPTLLQLARLPKEQWPAFLDGRDLSPYWRAQKADEDEDEDGDRDQAVRELVESPPETVNVEFWGTSIVEVALSGYATYDSRNTYKTVRVVGPDYGYLYSHWCTNETELYDTVADAYELTPLNLSAPSVAPLRNRLNALLLVTKTCEQLSCRNPWTTLHPAGNVRSLAAALAPAYDAYYASFPAVRFRECLGYQLQSNEAPYFPALVDGIAFGQRFRNKSATDALATSVSGAAKISDAGRYGDAYLGFEQIERTKRRLTSEELDYASEDAGAAVKY